MENKKDSLLSRWKSQNKKNDVSKTGFEILQVPDDASIPLSNEQRRLWFLQQLNPNSSFYNYAEVFRIKGNLKIDLLEQSIRYIENNHDILKSCIKVINGTPISKTKAECLSKFLYHDFSTIDVQHALQKANQSIREHSRTVFDLSKGGLFRSIVIKIKENEFLFSVVFHHIIIDEWSMRIFRKALIDHYNVLCKALQPEILKPKIQYKDYAYWQQNKALNTNHLNYWKAQLSGVIPVLNLPLDYHRKSHPSYNGTFHTQEYNKKLSERFFEFCKTIEATPYVVTLSLYYTLLQKYCNQEDILIGTSITKRNHKKLEQLIGFFNDTLVLRTKVKSELSFVNLVKKVKQTTLDAFSHDDISFDKIVKNLNPERSLSIHPFFQVMFLFHNDHEIISDDSEIEISHEIYDNGNAKFDLTLQFTNNNGHLSSLLVYNTDLFRKETIEQMHMHFKLLLEKVIENPNVRLENLVIATENEQKIFVDIENPSSPIHPTYNGIHEYIVHRASVSGDTVAIIYKDQKITYSALNTEANKVASKLIQGGIQPNDIVALSIERSPKVIVGLLGILKAGAAYLPLDPKYPLNRTNYILEHSNAKALLTEKHLLESDYSAFSISSYSIEDILQNENTIDLNQLPVVESENLAYVIYTSGSTGKPKGVAISHKNIVNSTLARSVFYQKDPAVFLLMSSFSFDSSKAGLFWTLCNGGSLVISEDKLEQDVYKLTNTIKEHKVSHTLVLPSLYNAILSDAAVDTLNTLQTIIVAGEACSTSLVALHFNKIPQTELYNEYGPTEGTVWSIAHKIEKEDVKKQTIPIGKPVANTAIYVLNDSLNRVPYGTQGELYIGGKNIAIGYLNEVDKTEDSFITNPFKPNQKIYKTGDLVKYNRDGTIQFLGRKDQQVKVRGYRIELDEIAQQMYSDSNIKTAIVTIENEQTETDWNTLIDENHIKLMEIMNDSFDTDEIEQLLTSVEGLDDREIEVVLKGL